MRLLFGVDQDISRLYIAMKNSPLVCKMNRSSDDRDQPRGRLRFHWPARECFPKCWSINERHAEVMLSRVLSHFVNGHNVRVIESRRGFCLRLKPLYSLSLG